MNITNIENTKNKILTTGFYNFLFALSIDSGLHTLSGILDTLFSGLLYNTDALAGVGLCFLYQTAYFMIMKILDSGTSTAIGHALGRGDKKEVSTIFSQAIISNTLMTLPFVLIAFTIPEPIVRLMGAKEAITISYAVSYIKMLSVSFLFITVNNLMRIIMIQYGYKKECAIKGVIEMVFNIVGSLFFAKVLGMGVGGLALGTAVGRCASTIYYIIVCLLRPRGFKTDFHNLKGMGKRLMLTIKIGSPSGVFQLATLIIGLIINNMISSTVGVMGLAAYSLFDSFRYIGRIPANSTGIAVSAYTSTLYGSRDVQGMREILLTTLRWPLGITAIMGTLMLIFNRPLLMLYGVKDTDMFRLMFSSFIWLIFDMCLRLMLRTLVSYYTSIKKTKLATIIGLVVDEFVFIPLTILFLVLLGIPGIWIAGTISYLISALIGIICFYVKFHYFPHSLNDIMFLPKDYYKEENLLNFSIIHKKSRDFLVVEEVQDFLNKNNYDKKHCYFCALCIEELLTRIMLSNATIVDIRLFVSDNHLHISIRDNGKANNHLVFVPKDIVDGAGIKLVLKMATTVDYNYMIGFNVLNVTI